MIFKLFDAVTGGTQIGSAITNNPTLANGLFSVNLDFGTGAFEGNGRWLDISVTNSGVTQNLSPRIQVLPAPYALYASVAATVTNGAISSAQIANGAVTNRNLTANAVAGTNIASGQVVKSFNGLTDVVALSPGLNVTFLTNGNTVQISAGVPNLQVFGANGTFTVPTNVTRIMVEMWGAGGGGGGVGGSGNGGANFGGNAGGGGGGGYGKANISVTPGNNLTVTVGSGGIGGIAGASGGPGFAGTSGSAGSAGGTTSVASVSATGGGGGGGGGGGSAGGSSGSFGNPGNGGDPGTSTAAIRLEGFQGGGGWSPNGNSGGNSQGGAGAGGGAGGATGGAFPGAIMTGQVPGGGGAAGSDGAKGRVIIWW
jgi:hypothetical protein